MAESVLIAGGTGFLGQELGVALTRLGFKVTVLTRDKRQYVGRMAFPCQLTDWGPAYGVDPQRLEQHDVIINLCGVSIADTAWSAKGKKAILSSRVEPTVALVNAVNKCKTPKIFLQASGVGYYGDRGLEILTEESDTGTGFLAETSRAWEAPLKNLNPASVRSCTFRIGPVLGQGGGMLGTLDSLYSSGLGASLADGKHYTCWIHVDDLCQLFAAAITDSRYKGVLNAVAPNPVPYSNIHREIRAYKPWFSPPAAPRFALRAIFGKKAELFLSSERAVPEKALQLGFHFRYPTVREAFADLYRDQQRRGVFWMLKKQWVPRTPEELWPFFADAHNLERITPPFLNFKVKSQSTPTLGEGTIISYSLRLRGIPLRWQSLIERWQPNREFVDSQTKGPYAFWFHHHLFEPLAGGTLLTDRVQYALPAGFIGGALANWYVRSDVEEIFNYRTNTVADLFKA